MKSLLAACILVALALTAARPAEPPGHAYGRNKTPTITATFTPTPTKTATPVPTSTPPPVKPVRVIVLGWADHPATEAYRALLCDEWVPTLRDWIIREVGLTFTYTCEMRNSQYPISQVQGPLGASTDTPDACGEGMNPYKFSAWVFPELGILSSLEPHERDIILVAGGGGFAATYEGADFAVSVAGDWQAVWQTTGQVAECCPALNPNGDCEAEGPRTLGHEFTLLWSACYVYATQDASYQDNVYWWPDVLPEGLRDAIRHPCNSPWLYAP